MCLIGLLGLLAPRVVLIALWFFYQPFIMGPFAGVWIWPLLGLFLLPTTTLAYCWAIAMDGGFSSFSGLLILAMGILFDIGYLGCGRGVLRR